MTIETTVELVELIAKIINAIVRQLFIEGIYKVVGEVYKYFHRFNEERFNWVIVVAYLLIWALAGAGYGLIALIMYPKYLKYLTFSDTILISSLIGLCFGLFEYCFAFYCHYCKLSHPQIPLLSTSDKHKYKNRKWKKSYSESKSY